MTSAAASSGGRGHPALRRWRGRALAHFALLSAAVLAWGLFAAPALGGSPGLRTVRNALGAVGVLAVARAVGLSWASWGLARADLRSGLRWGAAAAAAVLAGYGVAVTVPTLRALFFDAAERSSSDVLLGALVLVPLGTVLWEEVLFRGALLGAGLRAMAPATALAASSVVFALWHLRPLAGAMDASQSAVVLLVTAVGGLVHGWLRLRSGSLAAPVCLHLATNSGGLLAVAGASALS